MLSLVSLGQHLYPVSSAKGCGFIDKEGKAIVPQIYQECHYSYEQGVGFTKNNEGWQLIDTSGQAIVEKRYDSLSIWESRFLLGFQKDKVDVFFRDQLKTKLRYIVDSVSLYTYRKQDYLKLSAKGEVFLLSASNKVYLKQLRVNNFSSRWDNLFTVSKDGKQGLYSLKGAPFLTLKYDSITYYKAGVKCYDNGKVGFKKRFHYLENKTKAHSELFFPAEYDDIRSFGEHFLLLRKNKQLSLYHIENKKYVSKEFNPKARPFNEYYHLYKEGKKVGLSDLNGEPITSADYSKILDSGHPDRIIYTKNGFYGFMDGQGVELTSDKFDKIYPFEAWGLLPRQFTKYKNDTLFGLVSINGDTLTGANYHSVRLVSDDRAVCMNQDSTARVFIMDTGLGVIDDWYDLAHINQLGVVKETNHASTNDLYVGEESYKQNYFTYCMMNKVNAGTDERYSIDTYSKIRIKEIDDYRLFLLYKPWEESFDPTDEIFTVISKFQKYRKRKTLNSTKQYYKSIDLIGDNVLKGEKIKGGSDYFDLDLRRMYLMYKRKYGTDRFLLKDIVKGNKHYPRVYEVEQDRKYKRYLLPYAKFTKHHIEPIYDSLILHNRTVLGRAGGYWDFAKPDTMELPQYTIDVTLNDTMIMSHQIDTSYYIYDKSGKEQYRFEDFECIDESKNGMVLVKLDSVYNYLNSGGKLILDSAIKEAKKFQNGFASIKQGNRFSVINRAGCVVLANQLRPVWFNPKGAGIYYTKKKFGLIDTSGIVVDTAKYSLLKVIKNTDLFTYKVEKTGNIGVLNSEGVQVLEPKYKKVTSLSNQMLSVESLSGKKGLFDLVANELIKPKYDKIKSAQNNSYIVSKGSKSGMYTNEKGFVVPVKQKSVSGYRYGFATVKTKKGEFFLLENGQTVTERPEKAYPSKVIADTLTYDIQGNFVGLVSKNIPVRYDEIIQLKRNKSYVGMRFSNYQLHNYQGDIILKSDTWLSARVLDENVLEVVMFEGTRYYSMSLKKWVE